MIETEHWNSCSAPICLATKRANQDTNTWEPDEEICSGVPIDKLHRAIRKVQRGYKKRGTNRILTYADLKRSAQGNLDRGTKSPNPSEKYRFNHANKN